MIFGWYFGFSGTTPQKSPLPSPGNPKREWEPLFKEQPKSDDGKPIPPLCTALSLY